MSNKYWVINERILNSWGEVNDIAASQVSAKLIWVSQF